MSLSIPVYCPNFIARMSNTTCALTLKQMATPSEALTRELLAEIHLKLHLGSNARFQSLCQILAFLSKRNCSTGGEKARLGETNKHSFNAYERP